MNWRLFFHPQKTLSLHKQTVYYRGLKKVDPAIISIAVPQNPGIGNQFASYLWLALLVNCFAPKELVPKDRDCTNLRMVRRKRQTSSHWRNVKICCLLQQALLGSSPSATFHLDLSLLSQAFRASQKDRLLRRMLALFTASGLSKRSSHSKRNSSQNRSNNNHHDNSALST